ncbi:hypothetical protein WA026_002482, partial [Henosepilachna vigintioctopunctata]
ETSVRTIEENSKSICGIIFHAWQNTGNDHKDTLGKNAKTKKTKRGSIGRPKKKKINGITAVEGKQWMEIAKHRRRSR